VELMMHRRILYSCFGENLNETGETGAGLVITGKHHLFLGEKETTLEQARVMQQQLYNPLHPLFAQAGGDTTAAIPSSMSFLKSDLPVNLEVMTLQVLSDGNTLLRMAHSFAVNESRRFSQPVSVNLTELFVQPIAYIVQTTLTATAPVHERRRHAMHHTPHNHLNASVEEANGCLTCCRESEANVCNGRITLHPMQVLAFTFRSITSSRL